MPRGRPAGSYKYKDEEGNPISVFEWRKLGSNKRTRICFLLPKEYLAKLDRLSLKHKTTNYKIVRRIVMRYFDEKAKKENK